LVLCFGGGEMIKIIQAYDANDFEDLVNEFESNNNVFATQTHIKFNPEHVKAMQSILKYINDMVKNESHSTEAAVIAKLREDTPLLDLPVDMSKLRKYISDLLSKNMKEPEVAYVPHDPVEFGNIEDDRADYYRHSEVSTS
jgi:DNA polymerase I-like protein with 3'-5' exonuclease and polymerase domains